MDNRNDQPKKTPTGRLILIAGVVALLMVAATVVLMPYIRRLSDPAVREEFKAWITSLGVLGYLVMMAIQIVQIVIAFIPGEPVEILAGVMFGGFGGLFLCLLGCVIASTGVFLMSKKLGTAIVKRYYTDENVEKLSFLKKTRNLEVIVFVLFLIPGTPKDIMTYIAGTTSMKLLQFLAISTFARIPSIVSSTFLGSSLYHENWLLALLMFVLIAVSGILGIVFKDKIISFYKRKHAE